MITTPSTHNPTQGVLEDLIDLVLRFAWSTRVELFALGVPGAAYYGAYRLDGPFVAGALVAVALGLILACGPTRRAVTRSIRVAHFKRRWTDALKGASIPALRGRVFPARKVRPATSGSVRFDVRVTGGVSVGDLAIVAETLAAILGARSVHVARDVQNASLAHLVMVKSDPFSSDSVIASPLANPQPVDFWKEITLGRDETGETVAVSLPERHLLIGGEPGSGKSVALNLVTAAAALDPRVELHLFDAKMVELAPWAPCAKSFVTTSMDEAIGALEKLQREMNWRYGVLAMHGQRKLTAKGGLAPICVVIDELAMYLNHPNKTLREAFAEALRDLVARGRAAAIIVVAATQKPSADTVPSGIRDLFSSRWAMRCSTREASDTILGSGWATKGYSAADIDAGERGVGWLLHEGKTPILMRSCFLSDDEVKTVAAFAADLRRGGTFIVADSEAAPR